MKLEFILHWFCPRILSFGSSLYSIHTLILTYQQQTTFENIVGKEEIARNEQFLLFPQCFLLNQKNIPQFVNIYIIPWLTAELEKPKIGMWGKGYFKENVEVFVATLTSFSVSSASLCWRRLHRCRRRLHRFLSYKTSAFSLCYISVVAGDFYFKSEPIWLEIKQPGNSIGTSMYSCL